MTTAMIAVGLVAALFAGFGLMRSRVGGGQACEGCAGGCTECAALSDDDRVEVNRVRK